MHQKNEMQKRQKMSFFSYRF